MFPVKAGEVKIPHMVSETVLVLFLTAIVEESLLRSHQVRAATCSPQCPEVYETRDRSRRCSVAQELSAHNGHRLLQIIVQFLNLNEFNKY